MRTAVLALILALALSLAFATDAEARESSATANRIVRIGEQYLGTPYSQLNCSEFTSIVYRRATGVNMPADPNQQRFYGYEPQHRKRGDLVYFREHKGGGISHVGIFLGHHQILHSSSYFGKVTESDIRYIEGYRGARRIR